jgi:hypothetical protein
MELNVKSSEVQVPKQQLMRHHQREDAKAEIESMENMLPQLKTPKDKGEVTRRISRLKNALVTQSPPEDLPGAAKDKLYKEAKALEDKLRQGMPSREEMRKNPPGTVGEWMRYEKANKKDILKWKNIQQMLEPTSDDPDLSNVERLRPNGAQDRFRADAQITGQMTYASVPQENWEMALGPGPQNTALKQVERVQAQKKGMSEEARKAAAERMRKMHAAKKQQQAVQQSDRDLLVVEEGEAVTHEGA